MKFITILFAVLLSSYASAQWQPNGTTTGNIYYNGGNVGIGTPTPNYKLELSTSNNFDGLHFHHSNGTWISIFSPNMTGGGYNGITQPGDAGIIFGTDGSANSVTNGFVIAPHRSNYSGLRIDNNGNVGIGTSAPDAQLAVNGNISLSGYGSLSSNRNPNNNYTNLFLGGGIADQANGSYKVTTDGGSNYFAAIKMDCSGGNVGSIKFYSGQSTGGSSYTISNTNLDNYARMTIVNGKVGIGTTSPDALLAVKGQVHANEVKVDLSVPGPDYVFEKDYKLTSLEEIKNYIDQNKHLPEVPSAKEMEKNGLQLGEMNMLLLKKIEELTLYQIEANRKIETLEKEIQNLKK